MYISCPKCSKSFVVAYEQLGEKGRKVKCSKCLHIWHQEPDISTEAIEQVIAISSKPIMAEPIGNGVNLPALLPIKIPAYLYTTPFLLLVMIIVIFVMLFPNFFGVKSLLNDDFLSIKDVSISNEQTKNKLLVSYKVLNAADFSTQMPLVRIRLLDKTKRVIKSHIVDHTNIKLSPRQFVLIKTELPASASTESIDLMIGNRMDFILRN